MRVDFHPDAEEELESAASWYAGRDAEVGRRFLVAVDLTIANIVDGPDRFAAIDDSHRSCAIVRFPYQVIFRRKGEILVVVAIARAKRRPGDWQGRGA